ncbi:hypothetical protein [Nocardia otitidiscaviarum]|uniref:hypothetical protein n=1 Tax=Nocardia otitidiscaviarum TaxID=1823 RepID=UPI0024573DF4|nr:hypothetical protein [Nocardia otitidiscaviarum]
MSKEVYLIALDDQGLPGVLDPAVVEEIFGRHGVDVVGTDAFVSDPDIESAWTEVTGLGSGVLTFWRPAGRLIWRVLFELLTECHGFAYDTGGSLTVSNGESLRRLRASGNWDADDARTVTSPDELG